MSVPGTQPARNTRLLRPDFTVAQRAQEAAAIIAAPRHGQVIAFAHRHHVSRQTASAIVNRVRRATLQAVAPQAPGRPAHRTTVVVDRERIGNTIVALAVDARAANAGTQTCLQTAFDVHVSAGKISGILKDAAMRAVAQLSAWPMPADPVFTAIDEIYDHGVPVLTAIEDQHLGVLLASKEEQADGITWGVRLLDLSARGLQLAHVVKDQGAAMATGLAEAGVTAPVGIDHFPFLRTLGRESRYLAHQATRAQGAVDRLEAALDYQTAPTRRPGRPRRPTTLAAYEHAVEAASAAASRAADVAFLFHQTRTLLEPVGGDGRLVSPAAAQAGLDTVVALLRDLGPSTHHLASFVAEAAPGLHAFRQPLAARHAELCRRHGSDLVQFVGWAWAHRKQLRERLPRTQDELRQRWGLDATLAAVAEVWHTFRNSHRASSIIESFNSVLRTHIHAHRGLPNSLLPLIVFRQNVRPFARGIHRGQAPFVALGILPPDARSWVERLFAPTPAPEPQATAPQAAAPLPEVPAVQERSTA